MSSSFRKMFELLLVEVLVPVKVSNFRFSLCLITLKKTPLLSQIESIENRYRIGLHNDPHSFPGNVFPPFIISNTSFGNIHIGKFRRIQARYASFFLVRYVALTQIKKDTREIRVESKINGNFFFQLYSFFVSCAVLNVLIVMKIQIFEQICIFVSHFGNWWKIWKVLFLS